MTSTPTAIPHSAAHEPTSAAERITNLDAIRGVAVLGILIMNAVSFGLDPAAYFNLSVGGSTTWLDWFIGGAGEIFIDQKTMGLFSMLFGAGIVLRGLLGSYDLTRTGIAVFILAVWALQLAWSKPWLDRYRYGPVEWLWRSLTYRTLQPLRLPTEA